MSKSTSAQVASRSRDRSDEAGALLYQSIVGNGRFDLEGPFLTSEHTDKADKADWWFRRPIPANGAPRPAGLVFAGSRFLGNRGIDDSFVGKYLIIRARADHRGHSEYAMWYEWARRPLPGDVMPSYWFYLTAWTDGPHGDLLTWAVVDMLDWASRPHVMVGVDPDRIWNPAYGPALPFDVKANRDGTPFMRFPIRALKVVDFG